MPLNTRSRSRRSSPPCFSSPLRGSGEATTSLTQRGAGIATPCNVYRESSSCSAQGCMWFDNGSSSFCGRYYRACQGESGAYYTFLDGKAFYGVAATVGYCLGETDGSCDGNCTGSVSACFSSYAPETCSEQSGRSWISAGMQRPAVVGSGTGHLSSARTTSSSIRFTPSAARVHQKRSRVCCSRSRTSRTKSVRLSCRFHRCGDLRAADQRSGARPKAQAKLRVFLKRSKVTP